MWGAHGYRNAASAAVGRVSIVIEADSQSLWDGEMFAQTGRPPAPKHKAKWFDRPSVRGAFAGV